MPNKMTTTITTAMAMSPVVSPGMSPDTGVIDGAGVPEGWSGPIAVAVAAAEVAAWALEKALNVPAKKIRATRVRNNNRSERGIAWGFICDPSITETPLFAKSRSTRK